jgi:threonine/homoserine/homoserine lactone efflux protein
LLTLIPGPNVANTDANTISRGRRAAVATLTGTTVAMIPHLALTCLGMTAVIAGAAEAFALLCWLGVAYLIYRAYRAFTAPDEGLADVAPQRLRLRRLALRGFLVSLSNPKTLFFFAGFFPHFVNLAPPPCLSWRCCRRPSSASRRCWTVAGCSWRRASRTSCAQAGVGAIV